MYEWRSKKGSIPKMDAKISKVVLSNPARKLQREINDKKKLQIQEERPEAVCGQLLGPGFVKEGQMGGLKRIYQS